MRADALSATQALAPGSPWHPTALMFLARAELLLGHVDEADDLFADSVAEARSRAVAHAIPIVVLSAVAERALIAIDRGEWARAQELVRQAIWDVRHSRLQESPVIALVYAVAARTALHDGQIDNAREWLADAQRRLPQLTYANPIPAAQTRLELARCYLALADPAGARTMLREVDAILRRCPDLGTLPAQAAELRAQLSTVAHDTPGASSLTTAELRVLPLLTTHLTFKEIGERLFLSRHTVKSHAMSIYRKLDVTSRSDAVQRAQTLGLL
jgi:LuxR family maltose regulon positive regulatory protein